MRPDRGHTKALKRCEGINGEATRPRQQGGRRLLLGRAPVPTAYLMGMVCGRHSDLRAVRGVAGSSLRGRAVCGGVRVQRACSNGTECKRAQSASVKAAMAQSASEHAARATMYTAQQCHRAQQSHTEYNNDMGCNNDTAIVGVNDARGRREAKTSNTHTSTHNNTHNDTHNINGPKRPADAVLRITRGGECECARCACAWSCTCATGCACACA